MGETSMIVKCNRKNSRPASTRAASAAAVRNSAYCSFGLCRVCFRELALKGELPGIKKASW